VTRPLAIPEPLRERQARASNPKSSAWVSANAGSGKTHVLAQRVLRLLLAGAPPAKILCLTFTKAAAANMADRVFNQLAEWTSLSDGALAKKIMDCGAPAPGPQELAFARQLFARTIETPGGLKIQTLHAFSERLLKLFPFEANVAAHFKVIDEREAKLLLQEARDEALAELGRLSGSAAALDLVARESGAFKFDELLQEALGRSETFADYRDAETYMAALCLALGLRPGVTAASTEAEMIGGDVERMRREAWAQGLEAGKNADCVIAASLRAANDESAPEARAQALTPQEASSPLLDVPYALRHAAVSTWLNAGVAPPQVAEWAGHSVAVLLKVYAKCIDGQDQIAKRRIEDALAESDDTAAPATDDAEDSGDDDAD